MFEHLDELQQQQRDKDKEAEKGTDGGESNIDTAGSAIEEGEGEKEKEKEGTIDGIFAGEAVNYLESCDGHHSRQVPEKFLDLEVRNYIYPFGTCHGKVRKKSNTARVNSQ